VQRFREALKARNESALETGASEGLFGDDVVWHGASTPRNEARGRETVLEGWQVEGDARIEVRDVYADGLHTVAALEWSAGGAKVAQAVVFHLGDAGEVSEFWSLPTEGAVAGALTRGAPVAEHRNLAVFRTAEETRARNEFEPDDLAKLNAFLREDVKWHGEGESQWSDGAGGREQVIGLFQMFKQATGGTIKMTLNGVFADDTHALSFVEITASRADKPERLLDLKEVNLFHLDADGRAFEFWGVPNDPEIMDSFWAP
jgi:ketosteroid isomerase-like protein